MSQTASFQCLNSYWLACIIIIPNFSPQLILDFVNLEYASGSFTISPYYNMNILGVVIRQHHRDLINK
jgi:hypothetical protein